MSPKKIIFFAILGIIGLALLIGTIYLGSNNTPTLQVPKTLKIWISEGTTESYTEIIEGFKKYAPEYAKTNIQIEKKTTDPARYRTLLLSTMADGSGPDIFMVPAGEDDILKSKIEPLPSSIVNIQNFDKRFDDVFLDLVFTTGSKEKQETYYLGIPLGYETLGIFYNKNLIKSIPKTWNEVDLLYNQSEMTEAYPTNLGLSATYTPNISDIIGLFLIQDGASSYIDIKNSSKGLGTYFNYLDLGAQTNTEDSYTPIFSIKNEGEGMDIDKITTLDLFMQGKIRMIFGYPSLIQELEKSQKRNSQSNNSVVVLTERIPTDSLGKTKKNIAKYNFFALSRGASEGYVGAKFLEYLSTPDAERLYLKNHPYHIAAQNEFYITQQNQSLSPVLARATIDAFIPDQNERSFVFQYGLKTDFDTFLNEYIDRNGNIDINNISSKIQQEVGCSIAIYTNAETQSDCEKK